MKGKGILIDAEFKTPIAPVRDSEGKIIRGLQIGDTLRQNQGLILILQPGELKLSPVVGVGIENMLLDHDFLGWRRKIRQQMELDGQQVTKVAFLNNKQLTLDAAYRNR